jgi:hypothetical protein
MACRLCSSDSLEPVLALGRTPLADALLRSDQLSVPEPTFPLELSFCPRCGLSQIGETVPPELLFCQDYPYYSSFSDALLRHARDNAERLVESRQLNEKSLVVELASNDGYLLRNFVAHGIPVLGIDPAEGPAQSAREKGVPTLCRFFGRDLAQELRAEGRQADVIIASNVLAHVPDLHGFVEGIHILLKPEGVAVIEAPYVRDLIDRCEFDTIYHEHLCYFSVGALNLLFRRHSLFANRVEHLPIHGGSLRLYAEPRESVGCSVTNSLHEEAARGLGRSGYYLEFAAKVRKIRRDLRALLVKLKRQGKRIAAYGAAAKGATLINYVDIGNELIDFVVDRNVHKHGLYMPGKHLPIHGPEKLLEERPDYTLLLTWNFSDEILQQQEAYRQLGGKFIIPIPHPCVV